MYNSHSTLFQARPSLIIGSISVGSFLILLLIMLLLSSPARADSLTVTSLADSGPGSLRQAIANAANGDTLEIDVTGVITLTSGPLVIRKDLTINGPGANSLAISGNNATTVIEIDTSEATVQIMGVTIRNGFRPPSIAINGGAGINSSGVLSIEDCVFTNNRSQAGGGAIANANQMVVTNTRFEDNTAVRGGAIYSSGVLTLTNSLLESNIISAAEDELSGGGGVYILRGQATIVGTIIRANRAESIDSDGGGIMVNSSTGVTIMNSQILNNTTNSNGGAIYTFGSFTIVNSVIAGNAAQKDGGAINYISSSSMATTLTISNTTIYTNDAQGEGGAISVIPSSASPDRTQLVIVGSSVISNTARKVAGVSGSVAPLTLINSTIANNTAQEAGAAVRSGALQLTNSTITRNSGGMRSSGVARLAQSIVSGNTAPDYTVATGGSFTSEGYNLFGNVVGITLGATDRTAIDPRLAGLENNGGSTLTSLPITGSPALDVVPLQLCATEIDQRGVTRPQGAACDIGSAEGVTSGQNFSIYIPLIRR